jgi:predicted MPP superfamily phosphohydrolase
MPPTRRARRTRLSPAVIALRLGIYILVTWGTLELLASGLFPGAQLATLGLALYTTIPIAAFALWRGWPFYPGAAFRLLVVRPFWYTQLLLPLVSAAGLLGLIVGVPFGAALLVGRILAGVMLAVATVLLVLGYIGTRRLVVRRVDVEVPELPIEFDGLRIVQLSDLHIGPHTNRRFLERVVKTARSLQPDIIAVTGDLVDDRAEDVAVYVRALGSLEAPLGVYMIPGNHDVYAGWEEVEVSLREARLGTVLVNEVELVHRGGATLALVGTGDPAGGARGSSRAAPDVDRALSRVPARATTIAFAHNPALWPALAARGVALTLSGHTHWGQFALPKLGWSLASPFLEHAMGAHTEKGALLYISPGTGYWGIPFRLGAPPEVTLVTLRRGESATAHVHPARLVRRVRRGRAA